MQTCAVILHYAGDYQKCMRATMKAGVDRTILIDNSRTNIGVAGGYKRGIEKALETDCDFILLLDDDNILAKDALENLKLRLYQHSSLTNPKIVYTCLRRDANLSNYIEGFINDYNAVLSLNILHPFFARRNSKPPIDEKLKKYFIELARSAKGVWGVSCSMFGGMFFHRDLIKIIGLPDEKFTMYGGDYEWSSRIEKAGGSIWVVVDAVIDEPPSGQVIEDRTYEATKGHVMFQKKLATNKFLFWINYRIYLLILLYKKDKVKRKALRDGYKA